MRRLLPAVMLFCLGGPLAAQNATTIAARASRVYRGLTSMRASFRQTIEDRMIGTQESRGELIQSGNANLVMRFEDPQGDAIVLDGTHVWIYTPSTTPGQVIRMRMPSDPVYGPNVLGRILDQPNERYEVGYVRADTAEGRPMDVLEFTPRAEDPLFRRAVIWLDRVTSLPQRLELDEMTGVHRTLALSRVRTNTSVSPKEFRFDVPSGVRVVEQ
jgi:outer membrane lipoprotein carrier protein